MAKGSNSNGNNAGNSKSATDELFESFSPNNMLNNAQRILSTAANVLEEEIAAGILAAKRIEKKVIDTDNLNDDPQELMSRIRRDTHEAVDLFLDAMTALTQQLGILTNNMKKEDNAATSKQTTPPQRQANPFVNLAATELPVKAGDTVVLHISLSNDHSVDPVTIALVKSDLAGAAGQKISAKNIILDPSSFVLQPKEEKEISITINVPKTTKAGHYAALYTDEKNPLIRTVVTIDVV
jgi:hypothetical protein